MPGLSRQSCSSRLQVRVSWRASSTRFALGFTSSSRARFRTMADLSPRKIGTDCARLPRGTQTSKRLDSLYETLLRLFTHFPDRVLDSIRSFPFVKSPSSPRAVSAWHFYGTETSCTQRSASYRNLIPKLAFSWNCGKRKACLAYKVLIASFSLPRFRKVFGHVACLYRKSPQTFRVFR